MAIQFLCPACSQPIEVDDEWASRLVACPYCRKTVTAPAASALGNTPEIPTAAPVARAGSFVLPGAPPPPPRSNPYAPWALGLSCLALIALLVVQMPLAAKVAEKTGPDPTREQVRQAMLDLEKEALEELQAGRFSNWFVGVAAGMLASLAVWVAGLVISILAVRRPSRRGISIAALIVCGLVPLMMCVGARL